MDLSDKKLPLTLKVNKLSTSSEKTIRRPVSAKRNFDFIMPQTYFTTSEKSAISHSNIYSEKL